MNNVNLEVDIMGRIRQFMRCICSDVNDSDKLFIKSYLDEEEMCLLNKLPKYDIKHCINVARDIVNNESNEYLDEFNINFKELIRSAILHDIGKLYKPLNVVEKSMLVLLNYFTKGKLNRYENKNSNIYIYYNHGQEGYNILKNKGYNIEFLNVIKNHHNCNEDSKWLEILRRYDNRN
ncbi:MAG: HDIG domain-containing protein [Clostridium sp.]|uniref:HDIG domain-containing metalloprotein n=1 Tax=Clostridium sp. TaxID=1506 RepID=UPI003047939F